MQRSLRTLAFSMFASVAITAPASGQPESCVGPSADVLVGVFEGRTPCGPVANEFTGFPSQTCEKIKWELTLYRDCATGVPSTYLYKGTRARHEGRWRIERTAGPEGPRTIYRLEHAGRGKLLSLLAIEHDVLLILDGDSKVLVGDASWSYALNRTTAPRAGERH